MPADLIVTNARLYTLDESSPRAEAMAARDGLIVAVGSAGEIEALAGPGATRADLGGRAVVPGMIDAHLHLLSFALRLTRVDLQGVRSLGEALERVRSSAAHTAPGEWVLGGGWDKNLWERLPNRWDLDGAAPANPVLLASKDGHVQWANSRALELAGIGVDTPDPFGGEIVRDRATGEPTGVLRENAGEMAEKAVPPPSPERCEGALRRALAYAASVGLTGLYSFEGRETLAALQSLKEKGQLPVRVCCHLWRDSLQDAIRLGLRTGFGDEWLRLGHLKLFLDGALGSQTAHMLAPYEGAGGRGIEVLLRDQFAEMVRTALQAGIAPAVHAIGDAANRVTLDVFEETAPVWQGTRLRPRIEHVQLLHPEDAGRPGRLGIVASMQPSHATSDWQVAEHCWGDRSRLAYAWRTLLDSGAVLAFGSDCPVEPIDPLPGLYAAVTRRRADGTPPGGWHPEQRLTPLEALRAYTLGSAYAAGEESIKGSLSAGKVADFIVLSEDPMAGPPELLLKTRVEATVVGGRVVHGELASRSTIRRLG